MDIQNLDAFVQVAETGSFSAAAETLHITQPAVSKRIALLEDELDGELFDRIGRVISLTEAGRALLPHAKSVQRELAAAARSVRDLSGEVSGELKLATSHHIGLHRLPPVLSRFSRDYTSVQIDIDFMDSEQAYELITQGRVEMAVVTLAPERESRLVSVPVWSDPLDFMVASDHELLQRGQPELADLSRHPAILPGLNTYTGQIIKRLFDERELDLRVALATNYLETIRMMASVGLGWTILPRSMGDDSLETLQIPGVNPQRTLGLVYHRDRSLSRAAQAFMAGVLAASDASAAHSPA